MQAEARATIHNEFGLHMRPSTRFQEAASRFASTVSVTVDVVHYTADGVVSRTGPETVSVNAKSLLELMGLGLPCGTEMLIQANGPDAQEAITTLAALVEDWFGLKNDPSEISKA